MELLTWSMASCYGLNRVGEQTTVVKAGDKQIESQVAVAYRRPGMVHMHYLDGPLKDVEVWEDRNRVYRYLPDKNRLEVSPAEPSRPDRLRRRLELVQQNYQATLEGTEEIAGRQALCVLVRSKHPGNPWKRMWIDAESYLMLGSEDYDAEGRLLRSTRFTSVVFRTEPEEIFRPGVARLKHVSWNPSGDESALPPAQIERRIGFAILLPRYLPSGYRLRGSFVVPCQCGCRDQSVQTKYGDGLNTISVFQCGHTCEHGGSCPVADIPRNVAVRRSIGNNALLFVSDIARAELEKMADSVTQ